MIWSKVEKIWKPPPIDVDAVLASIPWGERDTEVQNLIVAARGSTPKGDETGGTPLDATIVAMVAWSREPHVHLFGGSGRCIGVIPTGYRGGLRASASTLQFMDATGMAFSMRCWPATLTTVFSGKTSAEVTMGGERIGTCDQKGRGRLLNPQGDVLASVEWSKADRVTRLCNSNGVALARYWEQSRSGKTATRRYGLLRIIEFDRAVSREIRALTFAGEICHEIQALKDDSIG